MDARPDSPIPADLPLEVVEALKVLEQEGADALNLSRVATRLGRSTNSRDDGLPWPDERALRTDLATLGYHRLHRALVETWRAFTSGDHDSTDRLFACGRAYLRTAAESPALFALMRDREAADFSDPRLHRESNAALESLLDLVADLHAAGFELQLSPQELSNVVWDSVHRLTMRWADAALDGPVDAETADEAIELELSLLLAGGAPPTPNEIRTA